MYKSGVYHHTGELPVLQQQIQPVTDYHPFQVRSTFTLPQYGVNNSFTVVVVYINTMNMTFDFNFNCCQAFIQYGYTKALKQREVVYFTASLCLPVI